MTTFTYDHIHLRSPDPEATARYYERMFGAEIIRTMQQGQPRIDLKLGGANIFLAPVTTGDGGASFNNTTLAGNFKTKYAERLMDERLVATPLLDMVSFKKKTGAISLELDIPIPLTHHQGSTFQAAGDTTSLRVPVASQVKYAKVTNTEIITVFKVPFGTVALVEPSVT